MWKREPHNFWSSGIDLGDGYSLIGLDPEDGQAAVLLDGRRIATLTPEPDAEEDPIDVARYAISMYESRQKSAQFTASCDTALDAAGLPEVKLTVSIRGAAAVLSYKEAAWLLGSLATAVAEAHGSIDPKDNLPDYELDRLWSALENANEQLAKPAGHAIPCDPGGP